VIPLIKINSESLKLKRLIGQMASGRAPAAVQTNFLSAAHQLRVLTIAMQIVCKQPKCFTAILARLNFTFRNLNIS